MKNYNQHDLLMEFKHITSMSNGKRAYFIKLIFCLKSSRCMFGTFGKLSNDFFWFVQEVHGLINLDHYFNDFFFVEMSDIEYSNSMFKIQSYL
jgi:hypothetical protein